MKRLVDLVPLVLALSICTDGKLIDFISAKPELDFGKNLTYDEVNVESLVYFTLLYFEETSAVTVGFDFEELRLKSHELDVILMDIMRTLDVKIYSNVLNMQDGGQVWLVTSLDGLKLNKRPRRLLVILAVENVNNANNSTSVESFLENLWRKYTFMEVVVVTVSQAFSSVQVHYYNPFPLDVNKNQCGQHISLSLSDPFSALREIRHRTADLHGYPLTAAVRDPNLQSPTLNITHMFNEEKEFFTLLAGIMHFTPKYMDDIPSTEINKKKKKSSSVEVIQEPDFNITPLTQSNLTFLYPMEMAYLVVLVKYQFSWPSIGMSGSNVFDPIAMTTITVSTNLAPLLWYLLQIALHKMRRLSHQPPNLSLVWSDFMKLLGLQSIKMNHRKSLSERILIASFLFIFSVVIAATFQGSVLRDLRQGRMNTNMKTSKDLIKHNVTILADSVLFAEVKTNSKLKIMRQVHSADLEITELLEIVINKPNTGILTSEGYAKILQANIYQTDGCDMLHIVPDKICAIFLAATVPSTSPFVEAFNRNTFMIHEAGLVDYFIHRKKIIIYLAHIKKIRFLQENYKLYDYYPLNLNMVRNIFTEAFQVYVLAMVVFFLEIGWFNFKKWWNSKKIRKLDQIIVKKAIRC